MLDLFKRKSKLSVQVDKITDNDGTRGIIIRHDSELTGKENVGFLEQVIKNTNFSAFRGNVTHLYESDFTGYKDKCPRCDTALVRMFSNFAYATQQKSRLLTAPAGLFCPNCPTAIVDDDMVKEHIDRSRFQYRGVFSIESGYTDINIIETLNGVKPVFVLDERQEEIEGIQQSIHQPKDNIYFDPKSGKLLMSGNVNALRKETKNAFRKQKEKKKSKNKMAKQSKKASRKK